MTRKIWIVAGAAVLVAVIATGGVVVASGAKEATPAAQEPPANTAKVERQELSAMISLDGTLTYRARSDGSPYSATNRARGTYTNLPGAGDKVDCGDVFYRVDDHPVLLLCGTVPAYRDLDSGDEGKDVRQLNRNLHELGYDADPEDSTFTTRTVWALQKLKADKGFDEHGQLDVEDSSFLRRAARIAKQARLGGAAKEVRQLNRTLHKLGYEVDPNESAFTNRTVWALQKFEADKALDQRGELDIDDAAFLPRSARIAKVTGKLGGSARPGAPVAQATSDTLEVQVKLEASQQGEVRKGNRAQITLPGNRSVPGKVDRLGRVAQVSDEEKDDPGAATIPAYIRLDKPAKASGLDRAPVQVNITTKGVKSALSVPVTALVGKSGGGFAVEVVRAGRPRELVAVELGLFDTTGGRVEVEGDLRAGDRVVVPSI